MEPGNWNVVVVGSWNRAILTPAWIQQTVLALPSGSPVEVLIPLDGLAHFQIRDRGVSVIPQGQQLIVHIAEPIESLLARAMEAARRAVEDLPRTPLRACGINIRYSAPEPPDALLGHMRAPTEQLFADNGYEIRARRRGESLVFNEGTLNVIADIPTTGECVVTMNFDLQSTAIPTILAWLSRSASEYITQANTVLSLIIK